MAYEYVLETRDVKKVFPGVVALDGISLKFRAGTVHALMGENGAGKSTLIKILAGIETPDAGTIAIDGATVQLRSPVDGFRAGIATVHQELSVVPELSIAENIFLGQWPRRGGRIDWPRMRAEAREALAMLGLDLDPALPVSRLSVAERQLVEIARALRQGARLLILDEPTSSLVAHEAELLIAVVRRLAEQGTSIIYISHRMDEIRRVAGSVTIMRDGRHVATAAVGELSNRQIIDMLLGSAQADALPRADHRTSDAPALLSLRGLRVAPRIEDASLDIRAGEVLGNLSAREYYKRKKEMIPHIMQAYRQLDEQYDIIVLEGACDLRAFSSGDALSLAINMDSVTAKALSVNQVSAVVKGASGMQLELGDGTLVSYDDVYQII